MYRTELLSDMCVFLQEFEEQIKAWCKEAGDDVTYDFAQVCKQPFVFSCRCISPLIPDH